MISNQPNEADETAYLDVLTAKKKGKKNNMEMCPSCKELRSMLMSSSTRIIKGDDKKEQKIKTLSCHGEKCNQFVRSEDKDEIV